MSATPVLTPLKSAFQLSRTENNIELILPELLAAQLHVVIGGQSEQIDLFLVPSPNPERQCVTVAEDLAFLAGIAFPKLPVTGAQLVASIPPEIEIVILHGDGANYLTREQLAWFRAMLASNA
jgi:fimbrial chaperone protein